MSCIDAVINASPLLLFQWLTVIVIKIWSQVLNQVIDISSDDGYHHKMIIAITQRVLD